MTTAPTRHRFTTAEYQKMAEAGVVGENDQVELIEGEIVDMAAVGRRHASNVDRLTSLFARGLGDRAIVRIQGPVVLSEDSEPFPDVVVLRYRADFYADVDAGPADVLLLVEVADPSLSYDLHVKAPIYARAGIGEYWVVDLVGRVIIVHREPGPDGYRQVFEARDDGLLSPQAFPDFVLVTTQILG